MEKITKEELIKLLDDKQLSDEELKKISGGLTRDYCISICWMIKPTGVDDLTNCLKRCEVFS